MTDLFRTDAPNRLHEAVQYALTHSLSARYPGEPDWLGIDPASAGMLTVRDFSLRRLAGGTEELQISVQRRPDFSRDDLIEGSVFLDLLGYGLPRLAARGHIESHHYTVRPADWHERYHVTLKGPAVEPFLGLVREAFACTETSFDDAIAAA